HCSTRFASTAWKTADGPGGRTGEIEWPGSILAYGPASRRRGRLPSLRSALSHDFHSSQAGEHNGASGRPSHEVQRGIGEAQGESFRGERDMPGWASKRHIEQRWTRPGPSRNGFEARRDGERRRVDG